METKKPEVQKSKPHTLLHKNPDPNVHRFFRYPNRRLYSATNSRYATIADVEEVVMSGRQRVEVFSRTLDNADITRKILLDVLCEKELREPTISEAALAVLIRRTQRL